ncbi:hypothetical protein [Photobacterium sp. Hal280]|uniref:hypothetical protein n=1 Tax=Photobacterium sp. Hal280 TaxID=3035163 RepID=UPI00301DDDF8
MKLFEVINAIDTFDDEGTIFVQKVDGSYHPKSEAVVIEMTDEELEMKTSEFARKRCPGKSYFLEVFIVQEVLEGWASNHGGRQPNNEKACHF